MSRAITIEDLYQITFVSSPRLSPDGQMVACVVTTIDERTHAYRSSIWVVPSAGGQARRFTSGPARVQSPCWSPDGRWLAFVSEREGEELSARDEKEAKHLGKGKPQTWLIPTGGGEAHQLTFMQHGASHAAWSPDSQRLVVCAAVGPADEETEDGKPLPKARKIDQLWYRLDGVGFIHECRQHLFLVDVAGGDPRQLTDGDWDENDPTWSPDGTHVAFVSSRAEDRWRKPCPDLYTLALDNGGPGELRCLTDGTLSCGSSSWSPDSQALAFLASSKRRSAGHVDLYSIVAGASRRSATCLTADFEGSCMDWTNSDMGDEHLMPPPCWSSDGKTLYVLASHRGRRGSL